MTKKNTDDLKRELMTAPELDRFLRENEAHFQNKNLRDILEAIRKKSGLSKAALAKNAGISEVYLHQILSGMRRPTRDKIICLAFSAGASEEETQKLLKHSGCAQLYAADRRDAILLFGIAHGMSLFEVNDALYRENEDTLI